MKQRVVIVNKDTGAKIYTTTDPSGFQCAPGDTMLVNPDTKLVNGFPPELWKLENERLVPVLEPDEVARRMHNIDLLPMVSKAVEGQGIDLVAMCHTVEDLPDHVSELFALHGAQLKKLESCMFSEFSELNSSEISRHLEIKHQRHFLVAIAVLLVIAIVYGVIRIEAIYSQASCFGSV